VRASTLSLVLCMVVGVFGGLGCQKPGPVRTKAMNVTNTDQNNDAQSTAAVLQDDAQKTGTKFK
jgi:hypothetical protein